MKSTSHRHPERKPEAEARQKDWASLSTAEQIKALDTRLGKGVGAAKQRARLSGVKKAPPITAETPSEETADTEAAPVSTKKMKAKERRAKAAEAS